MAEKTLGMALSLWLIEQRPGLLNADPIACAEAIIALRRVLGAQLATVLAKSPDEYAGIFRQTMLEVDAMARDTAERAMEIRARGEGGLNG